MTEVNDATCSDPIWPSVEINWSVNSSARYGAAGLVEMSRNGRTAIRLTEVSGIALGLRVQDNQSDDESGQRQGGGDKRQSEAANARNRRGCRFRTGGHRRTIERLAQA